MSERDVARLREAFERWNEKDFEAALAYVAEDVRWYPGGVFPDFGELYEGKDGVREFWALFLDPWEWIAIEMLDLRDLGTEVVVRVRFRARSHEGIDVDMTLGQRYGFQTDGLLAFFHGYASFDEALEAARRDA